MAAARYSETLSPPPAAVGKGEDHAMSVLARFRDCARGATAMEFSLLALPFLLLIVGSLQFYALHLMQTSLSDALYDSASSPEPSLLVADKATYKAILCNKTFFPTTCNANVKIEMQPLQNVPNARTAITGTTFDAGTSNDVLLLRAATTVDQFLVSISPLTAKAAVVFRRPI